MTPIEFRASLSKGVIAPAYLFLGPDTYERDLSRRALTERIFPDPTDRGNGVTRLDLSEQPLASVVDDARSMSLFATERLIWVSSAESALPRGRIVAGAAEEESAETGVTLLQHFVKNPVRGVSIVFDCVRYELDGEDKARAQRVAKFYSGIVHVEFERLQSGNARRIAAEIAKAKRIRIGGADLDLLVELVGNDGARIESELEKLSLYTGGTRAVTADDIQALAPNAKTSTIFALVNAVAKDDRRSALESLDVLVREGEYLPLSLSFLHSQFRLALAAKEAGLSSVNHVQSHFTRSGTNMWRSRAEQVFATSTAFSRTQLEQALVELSRTDRALRDARPDDRTVMENFVFRLTN